MKKLLAILVFLALLSGVAFAETAEELFETGCRYYDGVEVEQDYEKAVEYAELAEKWLAAAKEEDYDTAAEMVAAILAEE